MGRIGTSRSILIGATLFASMGMTACAANRAPSNGGPVTNPPSSPAATSPSLAAAPSATTGSGGVQNLVISSSGKSDLTAAFVAFKGISLSDILGAAPTAGTVYYAYDPATGTSWAMASFEPSSTASLNVQVGFQDGGNQGLYREASGGSWQVQQGGVPPLCAELQFFPSAVLAAWSMPTSKPPELGC